MPNRTLLQPPQLHAHYVHQLRQTINAYDHTQVVVGEAIQNALDAIVQAGGGPRRVEVELDLDRKTVRVFDDGIGFPNDPDLLFLGGSTKKSGAKKLFGLVGVGIKVVLFSSRWFRLRARNSEGHFRYEVRDACEFDREPPPELPVPEHFDPDPSPLPSTGTEVAYAFPDDDRIKGFFADVMARALDDSTNSGFAQTLRRAVENGSFDSRLSALLAAYLRRYTYVGDVRGALKDKIELQDTAVVVRVTCSRPEEVLGGDLGSFFDGKTAVECSIPTRYLTVEDVSAWLRPEYRPGLFHDSLGRGGTALERTARGFNVLVYKKESEFRKLLTKADGTLLEPEASRYRERLFPHVNGIMVTIGRIPMFREYLPGGSRRVLSANGVPTTHELPFEKGQNQAYVRCLDIVVDVNCPLNYGKTQLTNNHLVKLVRDFLNDAYRTTLQTATGRWVGRVEDPNGGRRSDVYLARRDLGLTGFVLQKEPQDENDVIALFFELAGRGCITGYRIFGLSQADSYDARGLIRRRGDTRDPDVPFTDSNLQVVEFKLSASSITRDFDRRAKDPRDIDLIVAWEEGTLDSPQYSFGDIELSRHFPDGVFDGVTRFLEDTRTGRQIQVLVLRRVVERLRSTGAGS